MYRKHKDDQTLDGSDTEDGDEDINLERAVPLEIDDDAISSTVGQCASYILQLHTTKNVSQTAVDDIVSNTKQLISNINEINFNCQKVEEHLRSIGVNIDDINLDGIFTDDIFTGLEN